MTNRLLRKLKKYKVVSFDVFDTLIERTVKLPSDIFALVGEAVLDPDNGFVQKRIQAEKEARARSVSGEVTLEEIYAGLRTEYGELTNRLMSEEMELEISSCIPKSSMTEVYKAAIDSCEKVFIISDMYLPSSVIEKMLDKCGINAYVKVYVSNEYNCNKISGKLFDRVILENCINRSDMLHIGDSVKADFLGARKAKISSYLIGRKNRLSRLIHG